MLVLLHSIIYLDFLCLIQGKMWPLTNRDLCHVWEDSKIWENLQLLVHRPESTYFFWLRNNWVDYVREKILNLATNISGDKLVSLGTCFGTSPDLRILVARHNSGLPCTLCQVQSVGKPWGTAVLSVCPRGIKCRNLDWVKSLKYFSVPGSGGGLLGRHSFGSWCGSKVYTRLQVRQLMVIVVVHQADTGEYVWPEGTLTQNEIISRTYGCVEGSSSASRVCVGSTIMLNFVNTVTSTGTS